MRYLQALAILQFHLMRHSVTGGKLVAYFVIGVLGTGALFFAGGLAWLFHYLGAVWFPRQPPELTLVALNLLLLIYFVGWFWGLAMEVQRSDLIDVRKMLYFPVPIAVINAINFVLSLFGITSLLYVASVLGLLTGVYSSTGGGLIAGIGAAAAFFFTAAAWAWCLRGLMTVWMENKRRRRLLMSILPLFFMAAGFMPMILSNTLGQSSASDSTVRWLLEPDQFVWVERFSAVAPTGWAALTLTRVITGEGPFFVPLIALVALGGIGYYLGHRLTLRYCFAAGNNTGQRAASGKPLKAPFTARRVPGLSDETAALALAAFLSFTRHPQMRTLLLAPLGMIILLAIASSRSLFFGQELGLPVIVIMWPFFMFSAFFFNLFGMDARSFRAIMMLPIARHRVLLAYHLALLPLAGGMGLLFALLAAWYFSLDPQTVAVCVLQVAQLFLLFTLAGSFVSIYSPFAMSRNMMRGQHSRSLLVGILMPFIVAILVLPSSACLLVDGIANRWGFVDFPAGLALSVAFILLTLIAYPFALRHAGDLLLLREQRILATLQKTAE